MHSFGSGQQRRGEERKRRLRQAKSERELSGQMGEQLRWTLGRRMGEERAPKWWLERQERECGAGNLGQRLYGPVAAAAAAAAATEIESEAATAISSAAQGEPSGGLAAEEEKLMADYYWPGELAAQVSRLSREQRAESTLSEGAGRQRRAASEEEAIAGEAAAAAAVAAADCEPQQVPLFAAARSSLPESSLSPSSHSSSSLGSLSPQPATGNISSSVLVAARQPTIQFQPMSLEIQSGE